MWLYFAVFVVLGMVGLAAAVTVLRFQTVRFERGLRANGVTAMGNVTQLIDFHSTDQIGNHLRVEYVVGGKAFELISRGVLTAEKGDTLPVRHLPEQPDQARIDRPGEINYGTNTTNVICAVAWVFTAASVVFVVVVHLAG